MSMEQIKGLFRASIIALLGLAMLALAACTETPVPRNVSSGVTTALNGGAAAGGGQTTGAAGAGEGEDLGDDEGGEDEPIGEVPDHTKDPPVAIGDGEEINISLVDFEIKPAVLEFSGGERTFRWDNTSTHAHNYRIVKWDDHEEIIYPGPKVAAKRKQAKEIEIGPGEYYIFCNLSDHEKRGMRGKLIVK